MRHLIISALAGVLVLGCASSSDKAMHSSGEGVHLILIPMHQSADYLVSTGEKKELDGNRIVPQSQSELNVWDQCGAKADDGRAGVLVALVGLVVDYVYTALSNEVAKEISRYQASFAGSISKPFYAIDDSGAPHARWSCARFFRLVPDGKGGTTTAFDLVAKISIEPDINSGDYLHITPLRLFYRQAAVPTTAEDVKGATEKNVSVAISLAGTGIWRQKNSGSTASLFNGTLLAVTCDIGKAPLVWYDSSVDAGDQTQASRCVGHTVQTAVGKDAKQNELTGIVSPVPPYSVDPVGPGLFQLTATEAEVGAPPKILCLLASALKSQKSVIEGALTSAIDEKLEAQASAGSGGTKSGGGGGGGGGSGGGQSGSSGGSDSGTGSTGASQTAAAGKSPCG